MAASKKKRAPARKKARKAPARRKSYTRSTSNVESDARKFGFKKKKPKKPRTKTIASLEKYIKAVEAWKRDQSAAAHNYRKLQGLKARAAKL